eukprot:TRINITY_DN653_c0_g1_i1.p1 TRINITY_DN653_c0_g1~~TRINITY_DN653_c0_g1_i1.p1  ORF type:complete len:129 (-),score=14.65 TRINITY_DN653_c0_g1_i1:415-801(-)
MQSLWRYARGFEVPVGRTLLGFQSSVESQIYNGILKSGTVAPHGAKAARQSRGLRVKVWNGDIEIALRTLRKKLISSGMDKVIQRTPRFHMKDSEKKVLMKKRREARLHAQELAKKLKTIVGNKVRGL